MHMSQHPGIKQSRRVDGFEINVIGVRADRMRPGRGTPFVVKHGEQTVRRGQFLNGRVTFSTTSHPSQPIVPQSVFAALEQMAQGEDRAVFRPGSEVRHG